MRFAILSMLFVLAAVAAQPAVATTGGSALAAAPPAATLSSPTNGVTLTSFGTTLFWSNPPGVTQLQLQVVPANNEGPGIDLHIGSQATSFLIPQPPQWYGLLPDMTYTWRIRVSNANVFANVNNPSWSPWAERGFRTPSVSSVATRPSAPSNGWAVSTLTPVLTWTGRSDVFYYEVQLSKDRFFNTDPATASASVYWALVHGGVSNPANSYVVPPGAPLEDATPYYWRVRPRVQGDGKPMDWSQPSSFTTAMALPSEPWLVRANEHRAAAKLPPVMTNPTWSDGCVMHAQYMVKNGYIGHSEEPGNPWYTPEGATCARSANVSAASFPGATDEGAIDRWMAGPFHALGILNPRLRQVGFGSYREDAGRWRMAAALDVLEGLDYSAPPSTGYPVMWPGDGTTTPLKAYSGSESPDHLTSCPGYTRPAGQPIILQIGNGNVTPSVGEHSLTDGSAALDHCIFDETSYTNPDSGAQALGRAVLGGRDAIVLVPRSPLTSGIPYTASITANGQTYAWSFAVTDEN